MVGLLRINSSNTTFRWLGGCPPVTFPSEPGPVRTFTNAQLSCDLLRYTVLSHQSEQDCNRLCYADPSCEAYVIEQSRVNPGRIYCDLKNCSAPMIRQTHLRPDPKP